MLVFKYANNIKDTSHFEKLFEYNLYFKSHIFYFRDNLYRYYIYVKSQIREQRVKNKREHQILDRFGFVGKCRGR